MKVKKQTSVAALALIVVCVCIFNISGQTIRTEDGKQFDRLNAEIAQTEALLDQTEEIKAKLLTRYTPEKREIRRIESEIKQIRAELADLYAKRETFNDKQLEKPLPDNRTELLKIIIIQNREIIELLRSLNPEPPKVVRNY